MSRPRQRTPQRGWCQTLFLVLTCCLRNQKQSLTPDGAKNRLSSSSLSLAINAAATQRNVQLCTEVDVRGGQQGSLEISEGRLLAIQHSQARRDQARQELTSRNPGLSV